MGNLELKAGNNTWLKVSIPNEDGDFEIEIENELSCRGQYCYINKEQAAQLRDFLNQFLD